jgi:hypothetical protein
MTQVSPKVNPDFNAIVMRNERVHVAIAIIFFILNILGATLFRFRRHSLLL